MTDNTAPHGYEEDGITPKTPFGVNLDGSPRKSNRGARPGQRGNGGSSRGRTRSAARSTLRNKTDRQRKESLVALVDMVIVTPLAGLSMSAPIAARFGVAQTDALAGDAVIVSHFSPHLADGLIVLSQTKPGALAWLDTVEEKAPYLMLMNVGLQMAKAFVENHLHPSAELAASGRLMAQMKMQAMATAIQDEAREMGIPTDLNGAEPTERMPAA